METMLAESRETLPMTPMEIRLTEQLRQMAEILRATHERMGALEQVVRRLEKVTPAQAAALNAAMRARAAAVCADYRITGEEKAVTAAIRRSVREAAGVTSAKDISRCDYPPLMEMVAGWDDYGAIMTIRRGRKSA